MLRINPHTVPFALTTDNKVPSPNRDDTFWDESGDVLLVTEDNIAVVFKMTLLLQYSATARSALGHIENQTQNDIWMPKYEPACEIPYLKNVLLFLRQEKLQIQSTLDELARQAFSAATFGIEKLEKAALTRLPKCMRERLNTYARWDGIGEFHPPPVRPDHAILASRSLPEPAKSMLPVAFVEGSIFGFDEVSLYPQFDAPALGFIKAELHDEDTIALLGKRNSELKDSLLELCTNFDKRGSLSRAGRPCCKFEAFAAYHAHDVPDTCVNSAAKGCPALSIIATLGAELAKARLQQDLVERGSQEAFSHPSEHDGAAGCLGCLEELHQGMMRLYGVWWEDMGRLLMGEPKGGPSAWDEVRVGLLVPHPTWWEKLWCLLVGTCLATVGLLLVFR